MEDERVDRLLRTLREAPPPKAAKDFTARVLARLDAPEGASANWLPRLTLPAVALAATLAVAASLLFTEGRVPQVPRAVASPMAPMAQAQAAPAFHVLPAQRALELEMDALRAARPEGARDVRATLAEIRSEHVRLESDLARLRRAGAQPVLYVGGDEQLDLIVNLNRVRDLPARQAPAASPRPDPLSNQTF
jgi:hypothetical protein